MSLQAELDRIRAGSKIRIPEENRAIMRRASEQLASSGQIGRVPGVGAAAPDFTLADTTGTVQDSRALRAAGALLVTFFRGHW